METLVEFSNYSFCYKGAKTQALKNVSFKINRGEYVSIIGPTGAGKTTICRSILGLIPSLYGGKSDGGIWLMEKKAEEYSVAQISAAIGYVHQDAESQIMMTNVEKEIAFPLENLAVPRDEIKERIDKTLALVHLEEYRTRHPFYLSGGQRQRVVLATVLAMNPDVLIFDEATSEIDPLGAEEIMTVTKELNDLGKTIIMIEHNMEEISRFANRIIVIDKGEVRADGTTEEVLTDMNLLNELEIYPPEVTQLFVELKKRGMEIEHIPMSVEHAVAELKRLLRR